MPKLQAQLVVRERVLSTLMRARVKKFVAAEEDARKAAARTATAVSRSSFSYLRPTAPARGGRSSTGGKLASFVKWQAGADGVELDIDTLNTQAPHWIIQEIGTGQRATLREGGKTNPKGRPKKGASYIRTVKSQRGRRIHSSLVFGTGPKGRYSPPGSATNQQLYLRSQVTGAPVRRTGIVIKNEIRGQHFVKKGGDQGFRQYRTSVLSAARDAFKKSNAP